MKKRKLYFWMAIVAYFVSMITGTYAGYKWTEIVFCKDE